MDMIKYERFEDWMSLLRLVDKTKTVYVNVVRTKQSENIISMNIVFQVIHDELIHSCVVSEGMPETMIVPEWVFSVLSTEKLQLEALADYRKTLEVYDARVHEEYKKAEDVIKGMGYSNIIMGLVQ